VSHFLNVFYDRNSELSTFSIKKLLIRFKAYALRSFYRDGFIYQGKIVASKIVKKNTIQNWNLEISV
jgi:hypothetical protein